MSEHPTDRRHGWPDRREVKPLLPDDSASQSYEFWASYEWWEGYDWDGHSFCDCGRGDCRDCHVQVAWWAQLNPRLLFEEDGLVHVTNVNDYFAQCGDTFLQKHFHSTDQATIYARVARDRHKAPTCFECVLAYADTKPIEES